MLRVGSVGFGGYRLVRPGQFNVRAAISVISKPWCYINSTPQLFDKRLAAVT